MWYNLFSHLSDALCGRAGAALRWALLFDVPWCAVSQWEERPEEEEKRGGETGRLGGRSRSALVPRVSLILCGRRRNAAEKSPSCPHSETGFIYSVPSSCVLLVVSRRWGTIADPDLLLCECVCLLLFSGLKRCNNETCSTLTLPVLFTVFCPRLSPFIVG